MAPTLHVNRLARATSPYLLQHAHNPVDWYPWGEEALALARREDRPIFLSIGYSACHWCHVMERESFEDEETARLLNEHFVCIKVDREERPDLDEIYMTAVNLMTGSGGWPLSVFLTPGLEPFFGGTYFPPQDRPGMPGLRRVIRSVAEAYATRRERVAGTAGRLAEALRMAGSAATAADRLPGPEALDAAARAWRGTFDADWGGFGGAPKFPQPTVLRLLMTAWDRTGRPDDLGCVTTTLDRMASGGLYDHLGGGFHRYAVDRRWLVPHFEKMLYDNALLAGLYADAHALTRRPLYARVARETLDYLLRELADPAGGFHSAQDADSEGEEGRYYLWTPEEVREALGADDAALFGRFYDVTPEGNFEGRSILHVPVDPEAFAPRFGLTAEDLQRRLGGMRERLLAVRAGRTPPAKDDQVLADWTALAVSALARGYEVLGDERFLASAERAAGMVLARMRGGAGLLHVYQASRAYTPAFLDDYAFLAVALVDLYEATFRPAWLGEAAGLADEMVERFWDAQAGGFFQTRAGQADLVARVKRGHDGATPAGAAVGATALARLAALLGRDDYRERAEAAVRAFAAAMERSPTATAGLFLALDRLRGPVSEIAVVGPRGGADTRALLAEVRNRFLPRRALAALDPGAPDAADHARAVPMLRDRGLVGGRAAAYVCRGGTCARPAASPGAMAERLDSRDG